MNGDPKDASKNSDQQIGMNAKIDRRDFLNGIAYTAGAMALQASMPWGQAYAGGAAAPGNYPPQTTGLAGQGEQANAIMHAIRDGLLPVSSGKSTKESFDLVVIGAGISGLAAAHEYKRLKPKAKILIIDPLDDIGGHAKRNEFKVGGKHLVGYGGSQSLQTPSFFSPAVNGMLHSIGIEPSKFEGYYDGNWFDKRGLSSGVYFNKAAWGRNVTLVEQEKAADWILKTPLSIKAQQDLIELIDSPQDYLTGLSIAEKRAKLADTTYKDFLLNIAKKDQQLVRFYNDSTREYFGAGIDIVSALDAWANGNPGLGGMSLGDEADRAMSPSGRLLKTDPDKYIYHFPDGNASVARALVRALIPKSVAAGDMTVLANAKLNYAALDNAGQNVRIRLSSSAIKVRHLGDIASAKQVEVTYAGANGFSSVTAAHVVMACWHRVIPFLTSEITSEQSNALKDQVKAPIIYGNVVIRNYKAFKKLGLSGFRSPEHFWIGADIDFPVSMGGYNFAQNENDPVVLHLRRIPGGSGDVRSQFNQGRREMLGLSFADYERETRQLLAGALGGGGFDAARDIAALTINRWAHGYAYEYMRPSDAFWPDGTLPIREARKGWGRVAVAGSDSGAYAYAHSAIDQGVRSVRELLNEKNGDAYEDFPGPPRGKLNFT